MKTLRFLVATALLSWVGLTTVVAAPPAPPANANFLSERGMAFGLLLDGQPLTRPLARQVHVDRLAPGQHWADFSVPTRYGPPMRFRTQVWLEPGFETSYVLMLRPGYGPQLRQIGAVPVAGPGYGPGPGYNGGGYPPGPPMGGGPGGYYGNTPSDPGNYPNNAPYGGNIGASPNGGNPSPNPAPGYPGGYGTAPAPNSPGAPAGGYGSPAPAPGSPAGGYGSPAPGTGYPGGYGAGTTPAPNSGGNYPNSPSGGYLYPLPPAEVQNLTQTLRSRSFDNERLPIVKQALAQSAVQADELAELIGTLSFDRSRIELAEYGYAHLSDPQNFYRVYDVLHYASSIREVQQALGLPQN